MTINVIDSLLDIYYFLLEMSYDAFSLMVKMIRIRAVLLKLGSTIA
ncbi:MAG: hypothetical protein ACSLEM_02595 [Candidatus Malihini olakiniferum]